jgi:hypothetical protein
MMLKMLHDMYLHQAPLQRTPVVATVVGGEGAPEAIHVVQMRLRNRSSGSSVLAEVVSGTRNATQGYIPLFGGTLGTI